MSTRPSGADADEPVPAKMHEVAGLPGLAVRCYMLAMLTIVVGLAQLDRQVMIVLVEPIRAELELSDTSIGLLTGLAFSLPFMLACIPVARLADRVSRRKLLAFVVAFWSVMTILCGMAQNFLQLLLARAGVGLGESGNGSTGPALLSDIFPAERRGTAASFYMLGPPIGMGLGLFVGGWVLQHYGWRAAFYLAGLPGLFVAALLLFTVRDVRMGAADGVNQDIPQLPFLETVKLLWSIRTLPLLMVGSSILALLSMGMAAWTPSFLMRSYGMSPTEVGAGLGIAMPLGSLAGHLAGGPLADWMGRRNVNSYIWLPVVTTIVATALGLFAYLGPSSVFFPLIGLQFFVSGLFTAPQMVIKMTLAPIPARATLGAFFLLVMNLIALGLGPLMVGTLSDFLRPAYGDESLRYAIAATFLLSVIALFVFGAATRCFRSDWKNAAERNKAVMERLRQ